MGKDLVYLRYSDYPPTPSSPTGIININEKKKEKEKCSPNNSPESFNDKMRLRVELAIHIYIYVLIFHLSKYTNSHPLKAISSQDNSYNNIMEFD